MRFVRRRTLKKGSLDIAPLIDVVLLLLIFFMLTSNMVNPAGFKIDLPSSSSRLPRAQAALVVTIDSAGAVYLGPDLVARAQLARALAREYASRGDGDLIVRADRDTRHGEVVEVMTIAKDAGWDRLAVQARPGPPPPE
ncbi:MAG TPA: biopolymer transporter ExbD [bacterium]|nr:biopolymer transporter ExbD [bacterium]HPQ66502.1 biopolymer transporter ExbD [bacterium]